MRQVIAPKGLWRDGQLHGGQELLISGGRIADIRARSDAPAREVALVTPLLSDLQVNGGGGVMVNDTPTAERLRAIAAAHHRLGTGDILPTVITDSPEVAEAAADAVLASYGDTGILGLHIEGPHLAPARRGTHAARFLRPLDRRTVALVERLRGQGVPVMITLAPELADPALLAALVDSGAVVSAGHSGASHDEAQAAFARGVSCVTHLFNAMDPMTSRAPGLLGAAIGSEVACRADLRRHPCLVADAAHRAAGRPRAGLCFAVSDAMATVGGPDHFTLYGAQIQVRDGRLINADGALAGAHVCLRACLVNLMRHVGLPAAEAIAMVTDIPRKLMGLAPRDIVVGMPVSDLMILDRGHSDCVGSPP